MKKVSDVLNTIKTNHNENPNGDMQICETKKNSDDIKSIPEFHYSIILSKLKEIEKLNKKRSLLTLIIVISILLVMVLSSNVVKANLVVTRTHHFLNLDIKIENFGLRTAHDVLVIVEVYNSTNHSDSSIWKHTDTKEEISPTGMMKVTIPISPTATRFDYYIIDVYWHNGHRSWARSISPDEYGV